VQVSDVTLLMLYFRVPVSSKQVFRSLNCLNSKNQPCSAIQALPSYVPGSITNFLLM